MLLYSLFYNLTWGKPDADLAPVKQNWKTAGPGVVIGLLLVAYARFTYVQFTYLFGGVLPVDLTYSEYAREGFAQFLTITVINFTVLVEPYMASRKAPSRHLSCCSSLPASWCSPPPRGGCCCTSAYTA